MNLLIVDDEVVAVEGMLNGIEKEACGIQKIWTAYNAENALRMIETQEIDLMLCDIEMPGASGIELLRKVRNEHRDIECIFLTCHAKFEYAQEAIALGCAGYILKPAPYDEITQKINEVWLRRKDAKKKDSLAKYMINEDEILPKSGGKEYRNAAEMVEQIEDIIRRNISNSEFMVSDIAEQLFLNRDYVSRIFKKEKGISLSQYIIQERMKLAALLMEEGNMDVNFVAEKVGYDNYPYFSSSFKRYFGCSPSQYKKEKSGY